MKTFFLVFARNEKHVFEKIREIELLGYPYLIVCGAKMNIPHVAFRGGKGKWDAINFGFKFVPRDTDVVVLNDVDTRIHNFEAALKCFNLYDADMVFAKVSAAQGPQQLFLPMLRRLRRIITVAASGDLMLVRYSSFKEALPIKPTMAEDSYLLFKLLVQKRKIVDCEECYVDTEKTRNIREEIRYKKRTVTGLYQALALAHPPARIRLFYIVLPFISPMLLISGKRGYSWMSGIVAGLADYLRGNRSASWQ